MGLHSQHKLRLQIKRKTLILGLGGVLALSVGIFTYLHFKGQERANTSVREQAETAESVVATDTDLTESYVLVRKKGYELEWRKMDYESKQAVMYVDGVSTKTTKEWSGDNEVLNSRDIMTFKSNEPFEYAEKDLINKDDSGQLWHSTKEEAQRFIGGKLNNYRVLEEAYVPNGFTVLLTNSTNSEILYVSYAGNSTTANIGTLFVLSSKEQASVAYKLGFNILPAIYRIQQ